MHGFDVTRERKEKREKDGDGLTLSYPHNLGMSIFCFGFLNFFIWALLMPIFFIIFFKSF